ncbi:granule associated Rac and RHOG effector protein 1-like [Antedon mediterranea]|uniref:granule associated Rac and RHOG effector protein 1-like n=1 Tax=Antedon mediterranea TaxID=105859 RepID=UPI003AF410A6
MSNFKKHFGQTNSRNEINAESKSHFHCSLPNSYKANLEEVQHHSTACLQAMRNLCQSANNMAEGFTTLFQDTPFCEVATNLQHISQELATTTGEVCQHVNDNVTLQTSRVINRGLKEKNDESIQVMAHCFLLMLQTQCQFFNSASQVFEPLVRFQSLEDFFVGDNRDEILKEACASWLRMSQTTKTLRRGDSTAIGEFVNVCKNEGQNENPKMVEYKQRLDALILTYKYEFVLLPKTEFTIIGGFHQHPQCSALVLNGYCPDQIQSLLSQSQSVLEEMLRYKPKSQSEMPNQEELVKRLQTSLEDVTIQVDGEICKQKSSDKNNFYKIMDLLTNLAKKTIKQNGLKQDARLMALRLLSEMSPHSTHTQSHIAANILFGLSNLISIEQVPIENDFHNYLQVSSNGALLIIEVPSVWCLKIVIPDSPPEMQLCIPCQSLLGKVEVVYTVKFDVVKWSDGKKQNLPIIQVKLCKELEDNVHHVVKRQNQHASSPQSVLDSPISNLRKKFAKLNTKFNKKISSSSNKNMKENNKRQENIEKTKLVPSTNEQQQQDGQVKVLVSPLVTITSSDNNDTNSTPWSDESAEKTKGFATDVEVQSIVDLLSGGLKPPVHSTQLPKTHPETLMVIANTNHQQEGHSPGWNTQTKTTPTYGNFNPHYQEDEYSDKRWANSGVYPTQQPGKTKGIEHTGEQIEFAQYLAKNFFKKQGGLADEGHALSLASQWSMSEGKMNRTWPSIDPHAADGSDIINHSWPMGHDSGSSSDGEESASGDTYSMGLGLSGPGLMASVNRRRHSSGGEESLHIPGVFNAITEPPVKYPSALLDVQLDPKSVRTWPPKNAWQRPSSPQPPNNNQYIVNHQEQLDVHRPLQAQWSDPLSVRHSNVWGPATGSTPVSPASSFTSLTTPQPHGQRPKSTSPRPHPRLDRKYAYNVHQFQSR